MVEPDERNDCWTRSWGGYRLLPDPDLGELEVSEPPLCHPGRPEELEIFMESGAHTKREAADEIEHSKDASSTRPSLVGAWSGTYEYQQRDVQSDGFVNLSITEHEDGRFGGSGIDGIGAFAIEGTIVGNKVVFTKSYRTRDITWKYVGVLDMEMAKIIGRWGPRNMEGDVPPVPEVEGNSLFNRPGEGIDGDGLEQPESSERVPPCDIEITVEGPSGMPGEERGEGAVDGNDRVSEAGSAHSSTKTDAAEVLNKGTFSLVRRPIDYFLYRPSDAEFQESRSKALWKMVRNAARHWYRSHHLTWDVLRERRDQRNRYTALRLKRQEQGSLYDPGEAAEWATIIQQTHPNDLHLWGAIAQYMISRTIFYMYVL